MKERQILAMAGLLLVVVVLVSATSAAAQGKKTPVDFWEVSCEVHPGTVELEFDPFHVPVFLTGRGRVAKADLYEYDAETGGAVLVGSDTVTGNVNIDLVAGQGDGGGVWSLIYEPASPTGTFDGTFTGVLSEGVFLLKAVAHGTGDMRGWQMKLDIDDIDPVPEWLLDHLASDPPCFPCPPPAEGPAPPGACSIFHDTGVIQPGRQVAESEVLP